MDEATNRMLNPERPTESLAQKAERLRQFASELPGADVPMTTAELRDTLASALRSHSHKDTTDWDLNLAMAAVEKHVAYRIEAFLADQAQEQTSPSKGDPVT